MPIKKEASRRKFHILYMTTCIITNKYYIGIHSTDDKDDGYMGSGKILKYSIAKYKQENHIREIISEHASRSELKDAEEFEISKYFGNPLCMNISKGKEGPRETFTMTKASKERMSEAQLLVWSRPGERERRGNKQKEVQNRPEVKKHAKEIQKEAWRRPDVKERHRISQEKALKDKTLREKHRQACKEAHNRPEVKIKHSIARRILTREQTFAVLELYEKTGKKSMFISKCLNLRRGGVGGVLKQLHCYRQWIEEWKLLRLARFASSPGQ